MHHASPPSSSFRHKGGDFKAVALEYFEVRVSDFLPFLGHLACIGLGARLLTLLILMARVRTQKAVT